MKSLHKKFGTIMIVYGKGLMHLHSIIADHQLEQGTEREHTITPIDLVIIIIVIKHLSFFPPPHPYATLRPHAATWTHSTTAGAR